MQMIKKRRKISKKLQKTKAIEQTSTLLRQVKRSSHDNLMESNKLTNQNTGLATCDRGQKVVFSFDYNQYKISIMIGLSLRGRKIVTTIRVT